MPAKNKKLPKKLQSVLWSYDLRRLDIEKDKELIITQVLNYGTWRHLQWLYKTYSEKEIKAVVKNPAHGLWFKSVLDFWIKVFDISIKKDTYKKALFILDPSQR